MMYSLFEYLIRKALEQEDEPLELFGKRKSLRSTGGSVLEILDTVQIVHLEQNGQKVRLLAQKRRSQVKRILDFLEIERIYSHNRKPRTL